jgi:hypothetical protein
MYIDQTLLQRVLFVNIFALTLNGMLFFALTFKLWPPSLIIAAITEGVIGLIWLSGKIQGRAIQP